MPFASISSQDCIHVGEGSEGKTGGGIGGVALCLFALCLLAGVRAPISQAQERPAADSSTARVDTAR
ncbi:MAG: hypothetical protein V5A48_13450, partial [Salinivenus sp.]